ncbi:MAG TPA: glycoside hydrolase family 27 protein, partial [Bacillota bacterium]|nr:glycoside hydrolase family 27 protein [Bacillota bacterium]
MKDFLLKRKVGLILIMAMVFLMLVLPVLFTNQNPVRAVENGLARTPPMGWNCWNCFGININETTIREIADVMISSGMKDAGYEYIIMDDGWQISRDSNGNIVADPIKFPNGIKAVADYVHSKGLKLGLYSDRGTATCCNKPGSLGYEGQDARTYAEWGIDYLKYDNCNADNSTMQVDYERMRDALATCGRP